MSRLDEIRARLAAATPGPWADLGGVPPYDCVTGGTHDQGPIPICVDPEGDDRPADRALIANAPEDLAFLLARVAELESAAAMGCENPPAGCDCPGCSLAREAARGGR